MYPIYPYLGYQRKCRDVGLTFPPQHQDRQPGFEYLMNPRPISENSEYKGSGKLNGKTALISGGDSGIGRAIAYSFAKEGANITIAYLDEHKDAEETRDRIEELGARCVLLACDLREEKEAQRAVDQTINQFGSINVLVNNHGVQFVQNSILDITEQQLLTVMTVMEIWSHLQNRMEQPLPILTMTNIVWYPRQTAEVSQQRIRMTDRT